MDRIPVPGQRVRVHGRPVIVRNVCLLSLTVEVEEIDDAFFGWKNLDIVLLENVEEDAPTSPP